jgi:collagenase-like PrtC family protease
MSSPKLLVPLSTVHELRILRELGADEFYCGVLDQKSGVSLNCHETNERSNLLTFEKLSGLCSCAHELGAKVFITLNKPYYKETERQQFDCFLIEAIHAAVDGVIVSDIGALLYVRQQYPQLSIHVSTTAGVFNAQAIAFFHSFGVARIVLPDHMRVDEVCALARSCKGVELEVFALNNHCVNIESYCAFHHWNTTQKKGRFSRFTSPVSKTLPFLEMRTILDFLPRWLIRTLLDNPFTQNVFERFLTTQEKLDGCKLRYSCKAVGNDSDKAKKDARVIARRTGLYEAYMRMNQCGVCGLYEIAKAGVGVVKLDGRYLPLRHKKRDVSYARTCLDYLALANDAADYQKYCQSMRKRFYGRACHPEQCYYPELW